MVLSCHHTLDISCDGTVLSSHFRHLMRWYCFVITLYTSHVMVLSCHHTLYISCDGTVLSSHFIHLIRWYCFVITLNTYHAMVLFCHHTLYISYNGTVLSSHFRHLMRWYCFVILTSNVLRGHSTACRCLPGNICRRLIILAIISTLLAHYFY